MEAGQVADAYISQGIPVIGALKRQEFCLLRPRLGTLSPILKGHFQGYFHRRSAVI